MNEPKTVDVVVIGAGAIGENVAGRAVRGGLSAVLVESELVGGECSYWACMPSKALLRPGEALGALRSVPGAKQTVSGSLDVAEVLAWRDRVASHWDDTGQVEWVKGAGIELIRGFARLTGERELTVEPPEGADPADSAGRAGAAAPIRLIARHAVVLATGSVPTVPPIPGLAQAPYWTTRDATSAQEIPAELIVLGGGVAGVELAQAFASLGSSVTLVSRGKLLAKQEPFAGTMLRESLEAHGVRVVTDTGVDAVSFTPAAASDSAAFLDSAAAPQVGRIRLALTGGDTIEADRLLITTGRTPATRDLGLEQFGIEPGSPVEVDDSGRALAVPAGWLYAAGDVNGRVLLTHQGKYQARVIGDVIAARAAGRIGDDVEPWSQYAMTADHAAVPQVVFTLPEIASVGLTVARAQAAGGTIRAIELPIAVAGSSVHSEGYTGRALLVIDDDRGVVVGATFVGADVGDLLHSATVAVVGEVALHRLWHAVPSYPTISEVWLRLLESAGF